MGGQAGGPLVSLPWKGKSMQTWKVWLSLVSRSILPPSHFFRTRDPRQGKTENFVPSREEIVNFRKKLHRATSTLLLGNYFQQYLFVQPSAWNKFLSASGSSNYSLLWNWAPCWLSAKGVDHLVVCGLLSRIILTLIIVSCWFSNGYHLWG